MTRPACVVDAWALPAETRPRFTQGSGVAAVVRSPGDATGLTRMGVHVRTIAPGDAGTNRHFHTVEEEWAYVLAGRGAVRIGPLRLPVERGVFVGFPPGPRPHHFIAEGEEPLVLLEGGERRPPSENGGWYPDARKAWRAGKPVEPYEEPPPEEGDPSQVVRAAGVPQKPFAHDVDPQVRRRQRALHEATGLRCQAVYLVEVPAGGRTTVFHTHERTDEWVFVLAGRAVARVGGERFDVGPNDFVGHAAGGPAHVMEAVEDLTYLMGGQIDDADVVTYPEAGLRRAGGRLEPFRRDRT